MKHTEEYLQAKYVVENPKEYDNRDVQRANEFMRAYEQALNICSVSDQRELLKSYNDYLFLQYQYADFDHIDIELFLKDFNNR